MFKLCKENRPNSICVNKCISNVNTSLAFNVVGEDAYNMLSHIANGDDDMLIIFMLKV